MKPVMYLFLNKGLGMSTGKAAAQVAHAAVEAYRISDEFLVHAWYVGGHYTKLVMQADDAEHLRTIKHYIEERGFKTKLIIDEGRTEIAAHSPTALGVEVVDKDDEHVAATFGSFKTYRDPEFKRRGAKLSQLELRDERTERTFLQKLRDAGVPISGA